jgi:coenzyme F420-reducing hydrogenase gamma subunit
MPAKVAFMQLSSCWGCHQSLLNAHLGLLPVLPELEIVYWPAVVDFKLESLEAREDGEIIVGFIEGAIRTAQDKRFAELIRKKCKIVVSLGTCATYGSVYGLGNLFTKEELLKCKFVEAPSIGESEVPGGWPNEDVPETLDRIYTVPETVDVDVILPGCPPTTNNIVASVVYLLTLLAPAQGDPSKNIYEGVPQGEALIDQGKLCFGSICAPKTDGTGYVKGEPWLGTYGLTSNPDMERAQKLFDYLASQEKLSTSDAVKIKKFLILALNLAGLEYMYSKLDPLQILAKNPEKFEEKAVGNAKVLVYPKTGNEMIDNILGLCLAKLRDSDELKFSQATVCSTCARKFVDKTYATIKRDYEGLPDMDKCFLEQGYVCIGPVTKAGCGTICPNRANAPCLGCYGQPENIPDQGAKMLSTFASLAQISPEEVKEKVPDAVGLFNRFTLAASTFKGKVKDTEAK